MSQVEEKTTLPEAGAPDVNRRNFLRYLAALAATNQGNAAQLALSVKTVETYRACGMEELAPPSGATLVRFALGRGLLD